MLLGMISSAFHKRACWRRLYRARAGVPAVRCFTGTVCRSRWQRQEGDYELLQEVNKQAEADLMPVLSHNQPELNTAEKAELYKIYDEVDGGAVTDGEELQGPPGKDEVDGCKRAEFKGEK